MNALPKNAFSIQKLPLPRDMTSYDLLKMAAVLLMIVDHIGYFFFPEMTWLRVAGRLCVPIWFFLIGYANSRATWPALWVGGLALVAGTFVMGSSILALNILLSFIVIRLTIDKVMQALEGRPALFWGFAIALLAASFHSSLIFEYGTLGYLLAMFGFIMRRERETFWHGQQTLFFLFAALSFIGVQTVIFGFDAVQFYTLSLGIMSVMAMLMFFRSRVFEGTGDSLPASVRAPVYLFGRHTLLIYVLHVLLFKLGALWLGDTRFDWFVFAWMGG